MQTADELSLVAQCLDDEFAIFFASFEESPADKATILIFPADLTIFIRKYVEYNASELNLNAVYIKEGNEVALALCPKYYFIAGIDTTSPDEPIELTTFTNLIFNFLISKRDPGSTLPQISDLRITDIDKESDSKQIAKLFDVLQVDRTSTRRKLFTLRDTVSDTNTSPDGKFGSDSSLGSLEGKMLSNFSDGEDSSDSDEEDSSDKNGEDTSDSYEEDTSDSDDNINVIIGPTDHLFKQNKSGEGPCMQTSSDTATSNSAKNLYIDAKLFQPQSNLNINAVEFIPSKILQKERDKVSENDGTHVGKLKSSAQLQNLPRYYDPTMEGLIQMQNQPHHVFPYGIVVNHGYHYLYPYPKYYEPEQQYYEDEYPQFNDFEFSNRCEIDFTVDQVDDVLDSSSFVIASENEYDPYAAWQKLGFMVELYNIPKNYSTNCLLCIYTEGPRYIKWCDDNHAILVTGSSNQAHRALFVRHPIVRSRAMVDASSLSVAIANKCKLTPAVFQRPSRTMENLQHKSQGDAEAASNVDSGNNKVVEVDLTNFENREDPTFGKGRNKLVSCVLNRPINHDHVATINQWYKYCNEEEPLHERFINIFKDDIAIVVGTQDYNQNQNKKQIKGNETDFTECILNAPLDEFGEPTPVDIDNTFVGASRLTDVVSKYFKGPKTIVMAKESYEPYQEIMSQEMEYIIELYNIPKTYTIQDILSVYKEQPCYIKRCDDTHALLVTGSPEQAKRALSINSSAIKSRSMIMSSPLATSVAFKYNLPPAMGNKNQPTDHNVRQHIREEQAEKFVDDAIEQAVDDLVQPLLEQGHDVQQHLRDEQAEEFVDKVIKQTVDDIVEAVSVGDHGIQQYLKKVSSKQTEEFVEEVIEQTVNDVVQSHSEQGHNMQQQLREIASKQAEGLLEEVIEKSLDIIVQPLSGQDHNIQKVLKEIASRQAEKLIDKIIDHTLDVILQPLSEEDHNIQQHLTVVASKQAEEFIEEVLEKTADVMLEPRTVSCGDDRAMKANTEQTDIACEAAELEDIEWESGVNYEEWY